jgi:hypothetical protein
MLRLSAVDVFVSDFYLIVFYSGHFDPLRYTIAQWHAFTAVHKIELVVETLGPLLWKHTSQRREVLEALTR